MTLTITVHGTPAGAGNKRMSVQRGKAHIYESTKGTKPWRDAVCLMASQAMQEIGDSPLKPRFPMRGPLAVTIVFTMARPKSVPKRVLWPAVRPDGDKLLRSTHDALKDAGLIRDDGQIVMEFWAKAYPGWSGGINGFALDSPGAVIEVRTL